MKSAAEMLQVQMMTLGKVINPRVQGEAKKVIQRQRRW